MFNRRKFLHGGAFLAAASQLPDIAIAQAPVAPSHITRLDNAEHYTWDGGNGLVCDGWHLVKTSELSVIEERLPAGARETPHLHSKARQFFFVIEGELTVRIGHQDFVLRQGEGLEVAPRIVHQAMNRTGSTTRMVLTSQPPSHGDRTEATPAV